MEFLHQERRGPGEKDGGDKIRGDKGEHQEGHSGRAEDDAQCLADGECFSGGDPVRRQFTAGSLGFTARRFPEVAVEPQRQHSAHHPEEVKANPPPELFGKPCSQPASQNRADIDSGLVERQRSRPRAAGVIIARERHTSREIKGLPKALKRTNGYELPEPPTPARCDGNEAPEQATAQDKVFGPEMVAYKARERSAEGIAPHEGRADQPKLHLIEAELLLELGKNRVNGLPVSIVKKTDEPEHRHHPPFVSG